MASDNSRTGSRIVSVAIVTLIVTFAGIGVYLWVNWDMIMLYRAMRKHCHPIWRDLASGKIREGDDLKEFLVLYAPSATDNDTIGTANVVTMLFCKVPIVTGRASGVTVEARDGSLTCACAWIEGRRRHHFFGRPCTEEPLHGTWIKLRRESGGGPRFVPVGPADNVTP